MGNPPPPPPHLVLFPFPAQGHINPCFNLALKLASSPSYRGPVSFLCTRSVYSRLLPARTALAAQPDLDVRFLVIPEDGSSGPFPEMSAKEPQKEVLDRILEQFEWLEGRSGAIQQLLAETSRHPPVSCMVVDSFFPWTRRIAGHLHARWCIFWTSSAAMLHQSLLSAIGPNPETAISSQPNAKWWSARWSNFNKTRFNIAMLADCFLINSFRDIDGALIDSIPMEAPVKLIGPLLSPLSSISGSLLSEDMESLEWLGKQPLSSVIFISFGSLAELPGEQLHHIALGIEASGCRFLWVIRQDAQSDNLRKLPEGFLERSRSRGLIVPWAPQVGVLKHPSIAFFLTHCGWNSVIESITLGVPMLCMPSFGDQALNCNKVVKEWGIGLDFSRNSEEEEEEEGEEGNEEGIVKKTQIERVLREAMEQETAKHFKLKSANLAELARTTVEKDGSSYQNLSEFLQIISTI